MVILQEFENVLRERMTVEYGWAPEENKGSFLQNCYSLLFYRFREERF